MGSGVSSRKPSNRAHRRPASNPESTAISTRRNAIAESVERISRVRASMCGPASADSSAQAYALPCHTSITPPQPISRPPPSADQALPYGAASASALTSPAWPGCGVKSLACTGSNGISVTVAVLRCCRSVHRGRSENRCSPGGWPSVAHGRARRGPHRRLPSSATPCAPRRGRRVGGSREMDRRRASCLEPCRLHAGRGL